MLSRHCDAQQTRSKAANMQWTQSVQKHPCPFAILLLYLTYNPSSLDRTKELIFGSLLANSLLVFYITGTLAGPAPLLTIIHLSQGST